MKKKRFRFCIGYKTEWKKLLLIMRISILFLTIFLQVNANIYSQNNKLNLTVDDLTLRDVFKEIESKSSFHFFYGDNLKIADKVVSIHASNLKIEEILDHLLENSDCSYKLLDNNLIVIAPSNFLSQQNNKVTGTVKDESGLPLPGVSVSVEGTANGTSTDVNGKYTIKVSDANAVLVFSYLGYNTEKVQVDNKTVIDLQMIPNIKKLDEVVLVGYGTMNRKEVSSAITHLTSDDLLTVGGNGALMSLQGKIAGLSVENTNSGDPNSSPSLQLRGVSSRNAGLGPLFVIDGIPGGNIDNINQNDIASLDVLKGGAASAIYGTRGSNGVILITTKKGTSEVQASYTNYFSFDLPNNKIKTISPEEFVSKNRGYDFGNRTNWMDAITRDYALSQKHTVSISGGNQKMSYYASGDYRDAEGIDLRSSKKEYGLRVNVSHTPDSKLYTINLSVAPRYFNTNNADYGGFAQALTLNPTQPIIDPTNPNAYFRPLNGLADMYNPVEDVKTVLTGTQGKYLDWSGSFKINITKDWNSQLTLSESNTNYFDFYFRPSYNTQAINDNGGRNTASRAYNTYDTKNLEWTTNYSLTLNKNNFKLLGGYSYAYFNAQGLSASNNQFPTDKFTYNNLGSGLYNLEEGQNNVGSFQNDSRLIAFFGRINYSFNNELFLSASIRHEGSSKFGANHKWGDFPAVSLAWDLSQRSFIKNISWIDNLKLRGDYGVTGNQDFGNYLSLDTYTGYGYYLYNGTYYQVYGPSQNTNYDLHWEKAINYNVGIDFSLLQSRIYGSLNYYLRKNQDLLGYYDVPQPPNVQGSIYANVGSMKNSGIELQLTGVVVKKQDWDYNLSFAGATLQNKFISFSNNTYTGQKYIDVVGLPAPGSPGNIQRLQEGERIGSFYMLKSAGVDATGGLLVYNKEGKVIPGNLASLDDKQFVGNGLPKFSASIGNNFRYKNLDLSVNFRGVFGYKIFNTKAFYFGTPATSAGSNLLQSAFDGGKYSYLTNSATLSIASDYFLENGAYVKLDNVTLGYTYHSPLKFFKSLRFYVTGRNLYTFTGYTGGDPENISINGLYPGVNPSVRYYPSTLQLLGGIELKF